ncbi:MAG TPA: MFS transporter, partial [Gaiellaceae bacterium]|nr:MFS transporter [Gaiellaceae bacterium]
LGQLYVVAFLTGTLSVLFYVSYSTLFVSLVSRSEYLEANALLNGSRALSFVGGPSLGGVLVQVFSAPGALVADAVSFLASAFALRSIRPVEPPTEEAQEGHLKAGIRYLWRSPIIRASLLATATINFFNFIFWALFLLYATRTLDVRPGLLGPVLGAASVGGVLGSIVTGRLSRRIGVGPAFALGCVLFPAPLVLVPLAGGTEWSVLAFLFAAEFLSGLGVMVLDITAASIKAALVPDRLRARVSGAYMVVNYGVRPVGSLVGGALGTWVGLRTALWIGSAGAIVGALWLLPSPLLRLRELPDVED